MTNQADNRHFYLFLIESDPEKEEWSIDAFTEIRAAKNFASLQEAEKYQETNREIFGKTDQELEDDLSNFHGIETRASFTQGVAGPYLFKSEVELEVKDLEDFLNNLPVSEVRSMLQDAHVKKSRGNRLSKIKDTTGD